MSWYKAEQKKYLQLAVLKRDLAEVLQWPFLPNLSWWQAWPGGWALHGRPAGMGMQDAQRSINFELPESVRDPAEALRLAIEKVAAHPERLGERVRWFCPSHGWEEIVPRGEMHSGCPKCGGYYCEPWPPPAGEE